MPLDTCRSLKNIVAPRATIFFCIPKGPASTPEIPLLQIPPIILPLPAERTHDPPHLTPPAGFSPSPIILTPTRRTNHQPAASDTPRGLSPFPDHPHPYPPDKPPTHRT